MAKVQKVAGGEAARARGVALHPRVDRRGFVDDDHVRAGEGPRGEGLHGHPRQDHPVHLPLPEPLHVLTGGDLPGVAQQHAVAGVGGHPLRPAHDLGEEGVVQVGHDDSQGKGAALHQATRQQVRTVAEIAGGLDDPGPGRVGNAGAG